MGDCSIIFSERLITDNYQEKVIFKRFNNVVVVSQQKSKNWWKDGKMKNMVKSGWKRTSKTVRRKKLNRLENELKFRSRKKLILSSCSVIGWNKVRLE